MQLCWFPFIKNDLSLFPLLPISIIIYFSIYNIQTKQNVVVEKKRFRSKVRNYLGEKKTVGVEVTEAF